jgi:LPXTG-site transpeptidase (sortase) family protein
MQKEPTIHQLEKLIAAFRQNGGTDAELSAVAQEIIHEFYPETHKSIEEIFSKEDHPTISEIKNFKKSPEHPLKSFFKYFWGKKYLRYTLIFIIAFLFFYALLNFPLIFARLKPIQTEIKYETVKEVVRPEMDKSAALEPGEVVPSTPTLVVPKIGVTAPIVFIESIEEKAIQNGLRTGVVHYQGTAKPGEVGNSFITGHSSNYWWEKGGYNYIFANLNKMAVGDEAKIYYNGNKYVYKITNIKVVEPTDTSVLAQSDMPTMTLMTCTPPGTNWKRLIVSFNQIAPEYKAPVIVEKKKPIEIQKMPNSDAGNLWDFISKLFRL